MAETIHPVAVSGARPAGLAAAPGSAWRLMNGATTSAFAFDYLPFSR